MMIGLKNKNFKRKIMNNFLLISFDICFGCSKELSHSDSSFDYRQHMLRKLFFIAYLTKGVMMSYLVV